MSDDVLKRIESKVDTLADAVKALLGSAPQQQGFVPPSHMLPSYDRPVLGEGSVVIDGTTINADGSIWGYPTGREGEAPARLFFGYISPVKTPEIFDCARRLLGGNFDAWFAQWDRNRFGVYKADVRGIISEGNMSYVTFGQLLNAPAFTHVQ
jgi:hypothetical protein